MLSTLPSSPEELDKNPIYEEHLDYGSHEEIDILGSSLEEDESILKGEYGDNGEIELNVKDTTASSENSLRIQENQSLSPVDDGGINVVATPSSSEVPAHGLAVSSKQLGIGNVLHITQQSLPLTLLYEDGESKYHLILEENKPTQDPHVPEEKSNEGTERPPESDEAPGEDIQANVPQGNTNDLTQAVPEEDENKHLLKRKQKLRQFFGSSYETLMDLVSSTSSINNDEQVRRVDKLTKFFGERPGELQKTEIEQLQHEEMERKRRSQDLDRKKKVFDPLEKRKQRDSEIRRKKPEDKERKLRSKTVANFGHSSFKEGKREEGGNQISIRIGELVAEPGSDMEKTLLDFLEMRLEQTKREMAMEKYGVAFGVRRGGCTAPCDCDCYVAPSWEVDPSIRGGPCLNCNHYPAKHKNLGKVGEEFSKIVNDVSEQIESVKRMRGSTIQYDQPNPAKFGLNEDSSKSKKIGKTGDYPQRITNRFRSFSAISPKTKLSSSPTGNQIAGNAESLKITDSPPLLKRHSVAASEPPYSSSPSDNFISILQAPTSANGKEVSKDRSRSFSDPSRQPEQRILSEKEIKSWAIEASELTFIEKLGVGSSAKVYRGKYRNQDVAIKVLRTMPDGKQKEDFYKEFEIMSCLRSPHVVYFYGAVLEPRICIVMEYCSRGSLYDLLRNEKVPFVWDQLFKIAIEAVRGVHCLHSWKPPIVHRDLKSLNLLLDENGTCKIADFGTSRFLSDGKQSTLGKLRGTYAYCPPEVYFGEQYGSKSDIFSMGIILWEMMYRCISGVYERPFGEYQQIAFDFQIILLSARNNLRPTVHPACPVAVKETIELCWAPSSQDRPDAVELLENLLNLQKLYEKDPKKWMVDISHKKHSKS